MIKLNITREEIRNEDRLFELMRKALQLHLLQLQDTILKDKKFYRGELPNQTYTINKAKYICDMATEMFIGVLPDITTYSEKEKERKKLLDFNKQLKINGFAKELYDVGLNASIAGNGYMLTFTEQGDTFPRYASLDPEYTNVVYDNHVKEKPIFAFTLVKETEYVMNNEVWYYRIYLYTDEMFYTLRTKSTTDLIVFADVMAPYTEVERSISVRHNMAGVPIVEFKNNELMLGDARPVYELIEGYNKLQNDRLKNIDDVIKYVLMLKNVRVGNEEEQSQFTSLLKNQRVLALEGDNVDAKFLTNPLDQTQLQTLADDFDIQIHNISRVPNFNSPDFAQNSSEPALKLKLKGFLDLAKEKERHFTSALSEVISMTLDFIERIGGRVSTKLLFDMNDIEIEYSHALPSNDYEKINQFVALNQMRLLNPRIALQQLSWIANVDEYLAGVEVMEDEQMEMLRNGGNNQTNRQRQVEARVDVAKVDNDVNDLQGQAQNLVEEPQEE
jgi:SPP1 family phage portal protein